MEPEKPKKASPLMKRVLANVTEDLKKYEEPDYLYELNWYFWTGRVPTAYRVVRVLAIGSKILRNLTRER